MPEQLIGDHDRSGGGPSPGRRTRRSLVVAAVLAVGLGAILSTSTPEREVTGRTETHAVPPIYRMMYLPNDMDRRIDAAKVKLITNCMAAHGLSYTPYIEELTEDQALSGLRPFGLESTGDVTTDAPSVEPAHSEEYARVLFGDPDQRVVARGERLEVSSPATGCQADAEYRLLGDQRQRGSELRLRLYDGERDAREQLDRDPVFMAANSRWRACINRDRIDAPNPATLLSALPGDTELANDPAVRADLRCKRGTGYLSTAYARLSALQQSWLDEHANLVNEWLDLRRRQDAVARQVLGPN